MKETVLITGANSFIAKHLVAMLQDRYSLKFLTRTPNADNEYAWDTSANKIDERALDDVQYIVHLAGAKLNDGTPLTEERKQIIYQSRIGASHLLLEKLKSRNQQIISFVSASAIGYYGFTDNSLEIDENGQKGIGFNADLSDDWEKAADLFKTEGVAKHVSKIRVSLVLGNEGGIFPMYKNIVASNPQVANKPSEGAFPWNHVEDMAGIFAYAVDHKLDGVFNSVAPEAATAEDVFKSIANHSIGTDFGTDYRLEKFDGQHLVSQKIINAGYVFRYPNIDAAVANLMSKKKDQS